MGGSTTFGRPFDDRTSFCGWLREFLPVADPSRRWEVVNAGGISYASYRVTRVMEEISNYQPDLFIVYSGHNEFLEARTYTGFFDQPQWLTDWDNRLSRLRSYSILKRAIRVVKTRLAEAKENPQHIRLSSEVDALLDHSIGPDAYHRDAVWHKQVLAHYRFNLKRMIGIARSAGARLLFVTPASNLKNCSPFKSEHDVGLSPKDRHVWRDLILKAEAERREQLWFESISHLNQAASIDDRFALLHFRRGQALYALGLFEKARSAFERARDEDICPLRALSSMPQMIKEIAGQYNVPVVDFIRLLENDSYRRFGHIILGQAYFYDHVHPVIRAHRILALELLNVLNEKDILEFTPAWERLLDRPTARVLQNIDRQAHGKALRNLAKVLSWAGKNHEAVRLARRALKNIGPDAELFLILGLAAYTDNNSLEAIDLYQQALALEPDYIKARNNLGIALAHSGQLHHAIAQYKTVIQMKPDHTDAHHNLGNVLIELKQTQKAIHHYRTALLLDPTDTALAAKLKRIAVKGTN